MITGVLILLLVIVAGIVFINALIGDYKIEYDRAAIDEAADYLGVEHCYVKDDGRAYLNWAGTEHDLLTVYENVKAGA